MGAWRKDCNPLRRIDGKRQLVAEMVIGDGGVLCGAFLRAALLLAASYSQKFVAVWLGPVVACAFDNCNFRGNPAAVTNKVEAAAVFFKNLRVS